MQNVQWPISFDTKNCESSLFSNRASPSTDLVLLLLLLLMMMMMMKQNIAVWNRSAIVVAVPLGGGEVNDADSWRTAVMPPRRYSPTPSVIQPCRRPGWENGRRAGGCRQSKGDGSVRCGGSHGNECRRWRRQVESLQYGTDSLFLATASFEVETRVTAHETLELVVAVAAP